MATQLASIGVGKLSSTAKYVDAFIAEIYSDAGYTVRIGQQTATAQWNGSAWVQKTSMIFGGLVFGTTYYLRAAVIAPLTGALSAWTTFNTAAGSASAPGCTYSGTFVATTSGIGYVVTPASIPSDIDHYEAVWQFDATVPSNTTISYWSGQTTNGVITFFVGGTPGQVAKVYVRAVNTSQQAQAWQLIDTRTVSSTWSFTTTGTIGDGTLLGTGGPTVNSGSTGRLGIGGTQTASGITQVGLGDFQVQYPGDFSLYTNNTGVSGRSMGLQNLHASGLVNADLTAAAVRTTLNSSGQYSVGGSAVTDSFISAIGSTGGAPGRLRVSGSDSFLGVTGTSPVQAYGIYNTSGVLHDYDETAASQRTYLNNTGNFSIGASPVNKLNVFGGSDDGLLISNPEPSVFYADTTVGSRQYQQYGLSNNFSVWDNTAALNRLLLNSSGQYGISGTPSNILDAFGAVGNIQGTASQIRLRDTQASGVDGNLTSGTATAGTVYIYRNGSPSQYLTSTGVGINGSPTQQLSVFGNPNVQVSQYDFRATNTETGGRTFGVGSSSGWDGTGYYQMAIDHTAGVLRARMDSSGQVGLNATPTAPLYVSGDHIQATAISPFFNVTDTTPTTGTSYYFQSSGGNQIVGQTGINARLTLNSSGQYGIGMSPSQALTVSAGFLGVNVQGTQPSVLYTDSGNSRNWSFGARGGPQLEMSDETAGLGRTFLSTGGGYGIGATPGNDFIFTNSGRAYFQNVGPGVVLSDTAVSGRAYALLSGSGLSQGFTLFNGTNANYPLMIDNSARTGLGVMTPADPLSVSGNTRSYGSSAGVWVSDRTSGTGYAFYGQSSIPRLFGGSTDFATFNPSTGAMGLGGTYTGDWISIQGTPVIASDKNLYNQIKVNGKTRGLADVTDLSSSPIGQNVAENPSFELTPNAGTGDVAAGWYLSNSGGFTVTQEPTSTFTSFAGSYKLKLSLNANTSVPASSSLETDVTPRKVVSVKPGQKWWVRIKARSDSNTTLTTGLTVRCGVGCVVTQSDGSQVFVSALANELTNPNSGAYGDLFGLITIPNPTTGVLISTATFYIYALVTNSTGSAVSTPATGISCDYRVDNIEVIRTADLGSDEVAKVGSIPPAIAGTLSYSSTTSSIAWSWSMTVYRSDTAMSTMAVSGSQTVSSLSASTSYNFYPFYDEGTLSNATGLNMVATGGSGSPSWAHSGTSAVWTQEQTRSDHLPLSDSPIAASTTTSGTGGGSGGGRESGCHRKGTFVKERMRGVIHVEDVLPNDYLWSENDTWILVKDVQKRTHDLWIPMKFNCGQEWFATAGHPYILRDRTIKRGYDLSLIDEIPCTTGITHPTSMSLVKEEHEVVKIEMEAPHTFYAATVLDKPWVLSHNYSTL